MQQSLQERRQQTWKKSFRRNDKELSRLYWHFGILWLLVPLLGFEITIFTDHPATFSVSWFFFSLKGEEVFSGLFSFSDGSHRVCCHPWVLITHRNSVSISMPINATPVESENQIMLTMTNQMAWSFLCRLGAVQNLFLFWIPTKQVWGRNLDSDLSKLSSSHCLCVEKTP